MERKGKERKGKGKARQGKARQGKARPGNASGQGRAKARASFLCVVAPGRTPLKV